MLLNAVSACVEAESLMRRSGCVQGPRLLKVYAVWAAEEHRILFYDATGVRFHEVRVSEAPDTGKLVA